MRDRESLEPYLNLTSNARQARVRNSVRALVRRRLIVRSGVHRYLESRTCQVSKGIYCDPENEARYLPDTENEIKYLSCRGERNKVSK